MSTPAFDPSASYSPVAGAPVSSAAPTAFDPNADYQSQPQNTQTPPVAPAEPSTLGKIVNGAVQLHNDVSTGIGQGALDTVHGTGELIRKGLNAVPFVDHLGNKVIPPVGQTALDQLSTPTNTAQKVGYGAENIAEFMLGDEALKGMSLADKLPKVARAMEVIQKNPILKNQIIQKMIATGVRTGTTGALQEFVHSGGDPVKAAEVGATTGVGGAVTEGILAGANKMLNSDTVQAILKGDRVAQPGAQTAVRNSVQSSVDATNKANAAREAEAAARAKVVPDEYQATVNEALKQEPSWTPEKAKPVVKALGDNFELRGSVGEGKTSVNDLDIFQKKGKLSDAYDTLKNLGFEYNGDTPHGETWTRGDQNLDLWDSEHEPVKGFGKDTELAAQNTQEPSGTPLQKSPNVTNEPLISGHRTFIDDHLATLKSNEASVYKTMDETTGLDVKAEKDQLANDQYKLKQLGNTDADVQQRGNLIESINDSEQRIADAETKMKAAGIDPKAADAMHQQRMAGQDFRKSLIKNTNPADGSVNVQGLLKDAKNLRFSKYGDRLEQFFGSKGDADSYVAALQKADQEGVHALKTQKVAKLVAGAAALVLGGGTIAKLTHSGAAAATALVP